MLCFFLHSVQQINFLLHLVSSPWSLSSSHLVPGQPIFAACCMNNENCTYTDVVTVRDVLILQDDNKIWGNQWIVPVKMVSLLFFYLRLNMPPCRTLCGYEGPSLGEKTRPHFKMSYSNCWPWAHSNPCCPRAIAVVTLQARLPKFNCTRFVRVL